MSEENLEKNDPKSIKKKLEGEVGSACWSVLKPHFLRGAIITIAPDLDIIDVGVSLATDDSAQIEEWMNGGKITKPSQSDAEEWEKAGTEVTTLVISPFVLVQQRQ